MPPAPPLSTSSAPTSFGSPFTANSESKGDKSPLGPAGPVALRSTPGRASAKGFEPADFARLLRGEVGVEVAGTAPRPRAEPAPGPAPATMAAAASRSCSDRALEERICDRRRSDPCMQAKTDAPGWPVRE